MMRQEMRTMFKSDLELNIEIQGDQKSDALRKALWRTRTVRCSWWLWHASHLWRHICILRACESQSDQSGTSLLSKLQYCCSSCAADVCLLMSLPTHSTCAELQIPHLWDLSHSDPKAEVSWSTTKLHRGHLAYRKFYGHQAVRKIQFLPREIRWNMHDGYPLSGEIKERTKLHVSRSGKCFTSFRW